ncbi:hypothetical protein [Allosalinactinospora lopnorensis]|uniref:hypothetical protein n=1 Tax=Allosalinactinospora lopnorensis TaxID=1352348 RepID=UPI000623EA4E|nr:hypothetical protein [Allosalinactinospora lopnorensis]
MSHDSFDWQANRRIVQLAERVDKAWRAQFAGPSTIPLSVVAALTLIDKAAPDGPDPDQRLMSADSTEVAGCITEIWTAFCRARPDLMYRVLPLLEWTQNDTLYANERDGIAAVTEAAARSGWWTWLSTATSHTSTYSARW